jgi:glucose-1-phosphate thymidylyltransferase
MTRKGIILAGGSGTRLYPITMAVSKQLLPLYDKPMIYYPLSVLMLAGIREIAIITTPDDQAQFQRLMGDGQPVGPPARMDRAGLARRPRAGLSPGRGLPRGRALGHGAGRQHLLRPRPAEAHGPAEDKPEGSTVFGYRVADPERYGVVDFDGDRVRGIVEKPKVPPSGLRRHRALLHGRHRARAGEDR